MRKNNSILFITVSDLSETSGSGVATKEIVAALAKNSSAEFTLVCPEPKEGMPETVKRYVDDTIYYSPKTDGGVVKYSEVVRHIRLSLNTVPTIRRAVNQKHPDAIVARMYTTALAPAVFARWYNIPYFLLARGTTYKTLRYPSVLSRIHWFNVRTAEMVYAASREIKADSDRMRRSEQDLCKIVPNGVDTNKFKSMPIDAARDRLDIGLSEDDFVVGFVGTMHPYHAVPELIESLPRLNQADDAKLLIVGDGEQMATCRELVKKHGIEDRVFFTGYVPHNEVPHYISACDVTYGAIKKESATPIKCFEYLACERPIILNEIEGLEFVRETYSGLIIDNISPGNISEAIDDFYRVGAKERAKMGKHGREYVLDNCTWDSLSEEVLEDVYSVIKDK